ncbi:DUF3368 domain-containing protein [Moorena sp. SIO3I6]|uniref:DUF3368 domain-containing protein n=1 Tax=Moorena sp. SIO3I6 TaxID=2607831 RepID=UPI0013F84825|nr:DUF3368 domain-containing protein [Moorena sp. SIO3I6]NEP26746.1 DUF3368 domain-containing protein [Moorena sp. SIO3I6]
MIIISDTSPITNLAGINQLNLLHRLYASVLVLMDERRGRTVAQELGLTIVGLLGILVQAKKSNLIPAVKPLMDQLIETMDFRISSQLYHAILQATDE